MEVTKNVIRVIKSGLIIWLGIWHESEKWRENDILVDKCDGKDSSEDLNAGCRITNLKTKVNWEDFCLMAQRNKVLNLQQIAFLFLAESVFCKILIYDNTKKKCNHRPMT